MGACLDLGVQAARFASEQMESSISLAPESLRSAHAVLIQSQQMDTLGPVLNGG